MDPLALPDYDVLHPRQILPRMEALDADALAELRAREEAGPRRAEVLARAGLLLARREHEERLARDGRRGARAVSRRRS